MLIQNKNLFPMSRVRDLFSGYFMDVNGNIYSTRRGGVLTRLSGSIAHPRYSRTSERRYTLAGVTYYEKELIEWAMGHSDFPVETRSLQTSGHLTAGGYGPKVLSAKSLGVDLANVKAPIPPQQPASLTRVHAPTLEAGILGKGYMIAAFEPAEGLLFTKRPAIHLTLESAKAEMERLAKEVPGTQFILVKILNTIVAGGVTWQ